MDRQMFNEITYITRNTKEIKMLKSKLYKDKNK